MNLPIFGLLWYFLCRVEAKLENGDEKVSSNNIYQALIFNLQLEKLNDVQYLSNCSKHHHYFTACPASTPKQIKFNEDFSITGESIFLKKVHHELDLQQNICEKPLKPVTVYHSKRKEYLIGYELYSEDGEIELKSNEDYENLRLVNMENNTICPKTRTSSDAIKYQDRNNTKFYFNDGSPTLVFHWIPVLAIQNWPPNTKQINFGKVQNENLVGDSMNRTDECKNYTLEDKNLETIYSEQNQVNSLKDILPLFPTFEKISDISCGQIYGCLEKSQIIPSWYYNSSSEKLASCSGMNTIPVWKSISNQLRKVDRLIFALSRSFKIPGYHHEYGTELIFGTSGVVKMNTTLNPNQPQEIHLSNPRHNQTIPIPEIIFRIFNYLCPDKSNQKYRKGAFIIHNNPSAVPQDKVCIEQGEFGWLSSWSTITNENPRTGLTYVCTVTKELYEKLGIREPASGDNEE